LHNSVQLTTISALFVIILQSVTHHRFSILHEGRLKTREWTTWHQV